MAIARAGSDAQIVVRPSEVGQIEGALFCDRPLYNEAMMMMMMMVVDVVIVLMMMMMMPL